MLDMRELLTTSRWTADQVARIAAASCPEIPVLNAADVAPVIDGVDVWDAWPVQTRDGATARIDGHEFWMMLSAPALPDPANRHHVARIRLLTRRDGRWNDRGHLLPADLNPGTREWAGSSIYDPADDRLTLYFTATGRAGAEPSFEQRLFETSAWRDGHRFTGWTAPRPIVVTDGDLYVDTRTNGGVPGMITGFRDPAYFCDPADGTAYVTFAGSDGRSSHTHSGIVGLARQEGERWTLLPPVLSADGLCNELERPHVLARDGRYYLFWSTQRHVFAPGASGPNGLYGAVADSVLGPYTPLNGTGLVAANPATEPTQTYSWLVLDTLEVISFVDYWGLQGRSLAQNPALVRAHFGGTVAPRFAIALHGAQSTLV